jgi:hypothetical protein
MLLIILSLKLLSINTLSLKITTYKSNIKKTLQILQKLFLELIIL